MKRIFITIVVFAMGMSAAIAQDKIITKSGDMIEGYRLDIGNTFIYYTKADNDDAALQKITKADVLMIKKQDNTVINLYEETAPPASAAANANKNTEETGVIQVTPESLSPEGKAANDALIANFNKPVSIILEKESKRGKQPSSLFLNDATHAVLGIKKNSVVANEDIEVSVECGQMLKSSKSNPAVFNTDEILMNPAMKFSVKNKTNKTIYLDLGNSFYASMGQVQCYYVPSSTTTSTSSSSGAGINLGAIAGAAGIGGVAGTLANGVNVGGGSTNGTTSTTYSQRVIAVPPMMAVGLEPKYIFGNEKKTLADGCKYAQFSRYNYYIEMNFASDSPDGRLLIGDHYKYQENTSPLQWSFILAYSTTEDCSQEKSLTSYFYLKDLCCAKDDKEIDDKGRPHFRVHGTTTKGEPSFPKN